MNTPGLIIFGADTRELSQLVSGATFKATSLPLKDLATFSAGLRQVDIAIVDVRREARLPDAVASFKRHHPHATIVLVVSALDPTLMLDAMRAGINECLVEPLTQAAVDAALERVTTQRAPDAQGDLFAFLGAKGGVGTTTVAVNVATALARGKERTLFIDLHVAYGDAAVFFGAEPKFSVADALENIHRLDESLFKTLVLPTSGGVDLLASSTQGMVWATDVQRVRRLLEFALRQYRYVVVDCPRSDAAILDALEMATKLVLVANQELATLRNGSRMAATLRQRYGAQRVMVVVSRFDSNSEIGHTDVERVIGSSVKHLVPSDYRASLEALNQGKPLVTKNGTRLAGSLGKLAQDLTGAEQTDNAKLTKSTSGIFGRLTGRR